jgi:superfamily II RNA helicase
LLQEPLDVAGVDESATWTAGTTQIRDLDELRAVIVDEIHFVDDPDGGTVWEELLIYLPTTIRILGLSATLSNLEQFAGWLSEIRGEPVEVVREQTRAVPLAFHLVNTETGKCSKDEFETAHGRWRKEQKQSPDQTEQRGQRGRGRGKDKGRGRRGGDRKQQSSRTNHIAVFESLASDEFPALYFIYSRKLTEQLALQLARSDVGGRIGGRASRFEIDAVLKKFDADFPGVLRSQSRSALKKGIAFHHAGLHVALKALVEELYEKRLIEVLYCTSTFALGINMPARSVVFDSLTKYNGVEIVPLTVREFMQMAGRAGRRGIDTEGDVIVRMDFGDWRENAPIYKTLVSGASEPVSSSFNLSFNSVVNLLDRYGEEQIRTLLERSFKAYQKRESAGTLRGAVADFSDSGGRSARKKLAGLRRELVEAERPLLWEQFQRKLAFLRGHGYINAQNELQTPARILARVQFTEVFVTELILAGTLEGLSGPELFGVFTGLVQTLPRTAKVNKPRNDKWWPIFEEIGAVFESDIVFDSQYLSQQEVVCVPALMPLGEMWASGVSLETILRDISNPTDLSGDIVGAFRRAKDLVGQLRAVYYEDEERRKELTTLIRSVSRDEVEVID